ncbi:MAG: gluconate 2-dehydrogenase subunit 3 family protein, partial [Sediminibacterium sp.]|nr:gluconate 2-dehydrogenase subunit 3 family protein [Sediminibacterium sp.]
ALYSTPEEIKNLEKLYAAGTFFNNHETQTLTVLADIIIPKDDISGSASDAKVVEFIDFMIKDQTHYQTPIRGGLIWLDNYCFSNYQKYFVELNSTQQIEVVDKIAYPAKATKEVQPGVQFFNKLRDLVVTAFYTSEMGYKDIGYVGNRPNQWNGVPEDVLKAHNLAYTEKELKECISFS